MHRVCLRGAGVLVGGDFLRTARVPGYPAVAGAWPV